MKIKFLFTILFVFIVLSNSHAQQDVNGWYHLNGKPTGAQLNWVQVVDAANIYAVGDRGTFMKSADGGDSWILNTQVGSPDNSSTGGLATRTLNTGWFFDANTGIVAGQSLTTTPGYISRTTDGGTTWNYIQYNDTGGTVNKLYFINSNTGYLTGGTRARFFKTTDGGLTWQDQSFSPVVPANTYTAVCATDTSHVFLALSGTSRKIYTHLPGQDSAWKVKFLPGTQTNVVITDIIFKDANTGYACGNPNYFAYTTDGGVTWTQSTPTASSTTGQRDLTYDFSNSTLYMAGQYFSIFKSTNDGVTWDSLFFYDNSNVNQPNPFIIYGMGASGNDLAVVGANGICNLSNDGGGSWRNKNYSANPAYTYYSTIVLKSVTGDVWVAGSGGGMMYSSNGGTNWSPRTTSHGYSILTMSMPTSSIGYIGGGSASFGVSECSKTTDGGNTWTLLSTPSPMNAYQINSLFFIDANTGWAAGFASPFTPALVTKTTDGGATWVTQTLQGSPNGSAISVQMTDANNGYVFASAGLFRTTDGGATWIKNTNSYLSTNLWSNMFVLNKDVVYLNGTGTGTTVGSTKKVVRTLDGGTTWTDLTGNLLYTTTVFRTKWLNLKHGTISGTNGYMAKTTNGGLNWSESNPGFSTTVDIAFPDKNTWYTVCDRNISYPIGRKYENLTSISVNVNSLMEGFWNGKPLVTDTVTVELHSASSPYALVDQAREVVNINGYATYEFYTATAGSYYIVVKHRNSLETWSSAPVAMTAGGNYNYDFTTAATQAYGSNMVYKLGSYCMYSGDVDQDDIIDAFDLSLVENNIGNSGYINPDVTGDDYVDGSDVATVENNQGIIVAAP